MFLILQVLNIFIDLHDEFIHEEHKELHLRFIRCADLQFLHQYFNCRLIDQIGQHCDARHLINDDVLEFRREPDVMFLSSESHQHGQASLQPTI